MSDKCGICLKSFSGKYQQKINCEDCKDVFHAACLKMSKADVECLTAEGLVWRCQPCASERRRSMRFDSKAAGGELSLEDIMKEITAMKEEQKKTNENFNTAYEKLHETLQENIELLKTQTEEIKLYKDEIEKVKLENDDLKKKNTDLEMRLIDCEQYSRRNCVEIHGIPAEANENVMEIVKKVGSALDIEIQPNMVDNCHRLGVKPGAQGAPGIIVKFCRRLDVEEILKRRRIKRNLSTRHMGLPSDHPVYVNESLCPVKRVLYSQARVLKRNKGFKYLWLRGGRILMRKSEDAPVIVINSHEDLKKL